MILQIDNITKIANNTYSIEFSSNFVLQNLFYEVSNDGLNWSSPVEITPLSPQNITVQNMINFKIRLSSNYTAPETGFLMISNNDKFLINEVDSLKYIN